MDNEIQEEIDKRVKLLIGRIDLLHKAINERFENLKKVIGDYLELSSSISLASVKTSLKNV